VKPGKQAVAASSKTRSRDEKTQPASPLQKRLQAVDLSRANLVGKFPHIQHQPAPEARCRLSEAVRTEMVERMALK